MEQDDKITIAFKYIDTWHNEYTAETTQRVIFAIGERELDVIGEQFNAFLRQVGYYRPNSYMLMDDLTQEEVEVLSDYLAEYRERKEETEDES